MDTSRRQRPQNGSARPKQQKVDVHVSATHSSAALHVEKWLKLSHCISRAEPSPATLRMAIHHRTRLNYGSWSSTSRRWEKFEHPRIFHVPPCECKLLISKHLDREHICVLHLYKE